MNILLCTLGASWAVIPEIFGWLAPDKLPLYAHHPDRKRLDEVRRAHALRSPDELWICTTEGQKTIASLAKLRAWWTLIDTPIPLRIWTAAGTDQLATQAECDHVRELTLRSVMAASERIGNGGQLVVSLAGGRKTMSADLQWAGSVFGASAWLHVVGPEPLPDALFKAAPETFCQALPAEVAAGVTPLVAGTGQRSELLDIELDGRLIALAHFLLPLAAPDCAWPLPPDGPTLSREIQRRERESGQLLGNFLSQIAEAEHHENWRSLYRLPPAQIESLRRTRLAPEHRETLLALPKADLHRHLGGSLSRAAQLSVGEAIADALTPVERREALDLVGPLLTRVVVHGYSDKVVDQHEVFYVVRVAGFEVDTTSHTEEEQLTVADIRWWALPDLAATDDDVWPRDVLAVLELASRPHEWADGPVVAPPVQESSVPVP